MASAPDAGAGWGPNREAAFQAWEVTQNSEKDCDEEEFSFTPQINNVKGVSSTMGDYMRGWSEKKELHMLESRLERQSLEREDLPFQPELPARAANETLLRGSGYAGPIQAWRQHATRYKQAREQQSSGPQEVGRAEGKKPGRQRSWGASVQRLYPYNHKAQDVVGSCEGSSRGSTAAPVLLGQEGEAEVGHKEDRREAGGDASAGAGATERCRGTADMSGVSEMSCVTPSKLGKRRCGRPPQATWQYLYESGTKKGRGKSMPPQIQTHVTPRPLQKSEDMLRGEKSSRRPLYQLEASPARSAIAPPALAAATSQALAAAARDQQRSRSVGGNSSAAGRRLFEQSERLRARQEQRKVLASEVKMAEEMRECTFRPQTNRDRRVSSSRLSAAAVDESALSLYERGIRARNRREQQLEEGAQEREYAELSECTFRPAIHGSGRSVPQNENSSPQQASFGPSAFSPHPETNAEESFGEVGSYSSPQQPPDLTTTVLTMLDDWMGQSRAPEPPQGMHYAPSARVPDQHFVQEREWQESASGVYSPGRGDGRMESHLQRHEASPSDVQALLQDWRGGWGSGGHGVSPGQAASPLLQTQVPSSPLRSSGAAALGSPGLPALASEEEPNIFAMLQRWRTQQPMNV